MGAGERGQIRQRCSHQVARGKDSKELSSEMKGEQRGTAYRGWGLGLTKDREETTRVHPPPRGDAALVVTISSAPSPLCLPSQRHKVLQSTSVLP